MNVRCARAMLGVSPSATAGQIKRAYRRLALDLHPDRGGDPAAFQRLVDAQSLLLSDASAKTQRSRWVDAGFPPPVATTSVLAPDRSTPAQRRTNADGARRPTVSRRFGEVLAEKLAAA